MIIRIVFSVCLLTALVACTNGKQPLPKETETKPVDPQVIQQWIVEENFSAAANALASVSAEHPNGPIYMDLRTQLQQRVDEFEQHAIHDASEKVRNNQWAEMLLIFDQALARLPESRRLNQQLAEFQTQQSSLTQDLQRQLDVQRARELRESAIILGKMFTINPRDIAINEQLEKNRGESAGLAIKIEQYAETEIKTGNLNKALELIVLAERLNDNPDIRTTGYMIRELLAIKKRRSAEISLPSKPTTVKKNKTEKESDSSRDLAQFDRQFRAENYTAAAKILRRLENTPNHKKELSKRRKQLGKAVDSRIDHLYEQGVRYYSQENYSLALEKWSEVLLFAPDHSQALEYSERARRILDKLEKLREKQKQSQ